MAAVATVVNEMARKKEAAAEDLATEEKMAKEKPPLLSIDLVKIKLKLATIILKLITVHSSYSVICR